MNITPDIIRCEFIGIDVRVARSTHKGNVGICGKVVGETRNTFAILHGGKKKTVAKDSSVFHFEFADRTIVEVNGRLLTGRPEDRLKKSVRRLW
ncbi:MAG: ribonuclease P protein component 1 [Candidatus Bathyarchaeia archaeon]|jgi:ribonuclease P protein subunit POP4